VYFNSLVTAGLDVLYGGECNQRYCKFKTPLSWAVGVNEGLINYRINRSLTLVHDTLFFHRPKYRYPYYDENGRGKLLYGYGGQELYQYKAYSPLEGIH